MNIKYGRWFTGEVKQKCQEKKKAYMKYRLARTNETYAEYKKMRSECHELLRRRKYYS
jgi:hypothetical protein